MEQTAVEKMIQYFIEQKNNGASHWCIDDLIAQLHQAKAMEKEQSLKMLPYDLDELAYHNSLLYTWLETDERDKTLMSKYGVEGFKAGFQKALELLTFKSE